MSFKSKVTNESVWMEEKGAKMLQKKVKYDKSCKTTTIRVLRAQNLPSMDIIGESDPYARVYFIKDRSILALVQKGHEKTETKKDEPNPNFVEDFIFQSMHWESLLSYKLIISVWDYDYGSKDDFIGGVRISMKDLVLENTLDVNIDMPLHGPDSDGHPIEKDLDPNWLSSN